MKEKHYFVVQQLFHLNNLLSFQGMPARLAFCLQKHALLRGTQRFNGALWDTPPRSEDLWHRERITTHSRSQHNGPPKGKQLPLQGPIQIPRRWEIRCFYLGFMLSWFLRQFFVLENSEKVGLVSIKFRFALYLWNLWSRFIAWRLVFLWQNAVLLISF